MRAHSLFPLLLLCALFGVFPAPVAHAASTTVTPPRLALVEGEASFWRPGAEDWVPARRNLPFAAGDELWTGADGRVETQVGPNAFLRAAPRTRLSFDRIDADVLQVGIATGTASFDLTALPRGRSIEVGTPNGAYTLRTPGYYRFDVDERATALTTRRGGRADIAFANGLAAALGSDETLLLAGTDTPTVERHRADAPDAWDRWNFDRTDELLAAADSARRVPAEVYGAADLDRYGAWREVPEYGTVWEPAQVAPGWAPYSDGNWVYDPGYGWTWVDDAPWGWAPFHYGRWVVVRERWMWAPGPPVRRPAYAPALVGWLGPAGAAGVGWVALGWGEPALPWWGRRDVVGRPWWGGWGGPRVVNRRVLRDRDGYRLRPADIRYVNCDIDRAVVVAPPDRLPRGDRDWRRLPRDEVRRWRPAERQPQRLQPLPVSLAPWTGRAARPPQRVEERPLVHTRAPDDVRQRLRGIGLQAPERTAPAPRVVQPGVLMPRELPSRRAPEGFGVDRGGRPAAPPPPGFDATRQGQPAAGDAGGRPTGDGRGSGWRPPFVGGARDGAGAPAPDGRNRPAAGSGDAGAAPGRGAAPGPRGEAAGAAPARGGDAAAAGPSPRALGREGTAMQRLQEMQQRQATEAVERAAQEHAREAQAQQRQASEREAQGRAREAQAQQRRLLEAQQRQAAEAAARSAQGGARDNQAMQRLQEMQQRQAAERAAQGQAREAQAQQRRLQEAQQRQAEHAAQGQAREAQQRRLQEAQQRARAPDAAQQPSPRPQAPAEQRGIGRLRNLDCPSGTCN
ncbi:DUF6600 domain-containing protein [Plasticicumulans lactativorans]|uniref:DUF6600 domain-containing protein n=1 Tax=Plasticicumulans lactativorans TaxID=1133106 RepID=UPI0010471598|nr:DUF6600 domain-containing protein [Plasticicumulans lactativorans]